MKLTQKEIAKIQRLKKEGYNRYAVIKMLNHTKKTINRYWDYPPRPSTGIYLDKPKIETKRYKLVENINYLEQIYEQLVHLNGQIKSFLVFVKYASIGAFLTTAIYFALKIGKII